MALSRRMLLAVLLSIGGSATVAAQDGTARQSFTQATIVYGIAAAADVGSTAYAMHYGAREQNPAIAWAHPKIGTAGMLALGTAVDVATVAALTRWLGPGHPRLVKVGLYTVAGVRGALAARNIRNAHQYRDFYQHVPSR